jgi:hypothetical protein
MRLFHPFKKSQRWTQPLKWISFQIYFERFHIINRFFSSSLKYVIELRDKSSISNCISLPTDGKVDNLLCDIINSVNAASRCINKDLGILLINCKRNLWM